MGNIPMPILRIVTGVLGLCAVAGFALGISQTIVHHTTEEEAPIAGNLPANAVIKDAQPLAPPPPPAPAAKAAKPADDADDASDQAASPAALTAKTPVPTEAAPGAPPGTPAPPPNPADLPPT